MSSELLLVARGLTKTYLSPLAPFARFRAAVFGAKPNVSSKTVLADVDLEIRRGETVGILGRNGAGKSTLLGMLGNAIEPTGGTLQRYGSIAVLLELGAGFNQDFSGRKNAEIYCRLMGRKERDIRDAVAGIEEFADLADYFDLPVRTYSSGMYSRLGFACAINVDAGLIIVDEALAVGDAAFRAKCYSKIERMQADGRTFLIVSHSPNLVAKFCTRAVVLDKGRKVYDGDTLGGIKVYKDIRTEIESKVKSAAGGRGKDSAKVALKSFKLTDATVPQGRIHFEYAIHAKEALEFPILHFGIRDGNGITVASFNTEYANLQVPAMAAGTVHKAAFSFDARLLPGMYFTSTMVSEKVGDEDKPLCLYQDALKFEIVKKATSHGIVDLAFALALDQVPAEARIVDNRDRVARVLKLETLDYRFTHQIEGFTDVRTKERAPLIQQFSLFLPAFTAANPSAGEFLAVECGVFRGHSLLSLAQVAQRSAAAVRIYGLDSFAGFPEFSATDLETVSPKIREVSRLVFQEASLEAVQEKLKGAAVDHLVTLKKGFFCDVLPELAAMAFAFVHIDCDLYEGHLECLEFFYPRMKPGGMIFFDDYHSVEFTGARSAIDHFLADKPERLFHLRLGADEPNHTKAFLLKA
jgi:ABC-type polysaccharide/polyol phosphate transport system ATPase subunit